MRTVLSLFLSALLCFSSLAFAQNSEPPYQIDEQATTQAPWKVGSVIDEFTLSYLSQKENEQTLSRKFIGITTKGYFAVQDFYMPSNRPYTASFVITQRSWADNLQPVYYHNTPVDGPLIAWHENGQKSLETYYQDGKTQGLWTRWHENGQKHEEGQYQDNKKQGLWIRWYSNGNKEEEIHFQANKIHGLWTNWFENGQKAAQVLLQDSKMQGLWTAWHENGEKREEGLYQDDKRQGLWTQWNRNGQVERKCNYQNGLCEDLSHRWSTFSGESLVELWFGPKIP